MGGSISGVGKDEEEEERVGRGRNAEGRKKGKSVIQLKFFSDFFRLVM